LAGRPWNAVSIARRALPRLAHFRPDVILNYNIHPDGLAACRCAQRLGVPVVLGALGSDLNRIPGRFMLRAVRRTLSQADFLLAVSDHLRRRAVALGMREERTRTVLNGCDTSCFRLRLRADARRALHLPADAQIVLFVGWLNKTKGVRELLEAFIALAVRHPRLYLACIGAGPLGAILEQQARAAGLAGRLLLPGVLPSALVAEWLGAANVFCLPSYMEGCPNAVVEALASGRPVVATNVGGIPELINDTAKGILISPGSTSALVQALEDAITRNWDEAAIARNSARDWSAPARETADLLQQAVLLFRRQN
jgi:glycosyltransferase involved in cell wall biosynthesis